VNPNRLRAPFSKTLEARPHTAVYMMHKYFARRPWNVFSELISHYSSPHDIILDPFCGGGVTVVESLKLTRRAVGVDVNPLATYVTEMQTKPIDIDSFREGFLQVSRRVKQEIRSLYSTRCANCDAAAVADWIEWDEQTKRILRLKYDCPTCGVTREKPPDREDELLAERTERTFTQTVKNRRLWFPRTQIPHGDKTNSLLNQRINAFNELFTRRNLLALSILLSEIERIRDKQSGAFLKFAFSSSLKWASRQSHLRGKIVEGWAMHAYWIYPKSLEINVWNTFERRTQAVLRGKKYSNEHIGEFHGAARNFTDLLKGNASCLILNRSATRLPFPDRSIDAVITDPPYGANVNYGELSDFWFIWMSGGKTIQKRDEVIINRSQGKALEDYQKLLYIILKECYRVLKPHRYLVSTFNSKDMRVVASFITAASRAGFTLHPNGVVYQKPIRPYGTTFHALQIGAFVGDFIFTFMKDPRSTSAPRTTEYELGKLEKDLTRLIANAEKNEITEPRLRENAYRILIPFLAKHAHIDMGVCKQLVDSFETKMSEHELHFKELRRSITEERRRIFLEQ